MKLVIGNMTYSSWSLRPWLLLTHYQIPFEQILVKLDLDTTAGEIAKYSPAGKVPVLIDEGVTVWESLAIMEYLNDKYPEKQMYPRDLKKRAYARSISNEMHSGFAKLRQHLPFNSKKRLTNHDLSPAEQDIARVKTIWTEALKASKGPYLLGEFSIADAMYAPVVGRFQTYGVPTEGLVKDYCETLSRLPAMNAWYAGADREDFIAPKHE